MKKKVKTTQDVLSTYALLNGSEVNFLFSGAYLSLGTCSYKTHPEMYDLLGLNHKKSYDMEIHHVDSFCFYDDNDKVNVNTEDGPYLHLTPCISSKFVNPFAAISFRLTKTDAILVASQLKVQIGGQYQKIITELMEDLILDEE